MKTRNLKEISSMDSLALTSVIDYWKDYDSKSVLLSYAELKRRDFDISDNLSKKQKQFCEKNSASNIDDFLNITMKDIGFSSYEEYFYKEFPEKALTEVERKERKERKEEEKKSKNSSYIIKPNSIVSAGKAIKGVVYTVAIMIGFTAIGVLFAASSKDTQTIMNTYMILGIASLVCNIIILFQLYSAGDNLENSVTIE